MKKSVPAWTLVVLALLATFTLAVLNINSPHYDWSKCDKVLSNHNFVPPTVEQYNLWKAKMNNKQSGSYALFASNAGKFACQAIEYIADQSIEDYLTQVNSILTTLSFIQHNSTNTIFSFYDSPFAATTREEYVSRLGNRGAKHTDDIILSKHLKLEDIIDPIHVGDFPEEFDWRTQGRVTPVKDQGPFGTCWAHSAAQAMEGAAVALGLPLTPLSVETHVECDYYSSHVYYADCMYFGGLPSLGLNYMKDNKGYRTEAYFPYAWDHTTESMRSRPCMPSGYDKKLCDNHDDLYCKPETTQGQGPEQLCDFHKGEFHVAVDKIFDIEPTDEAIMAALMKYGPLSIAANADHWEWYKTGIVDYKCSDFLNHAVNLIGWGYDTTENKPYWIVKNSWNSSFGEDGYIRMVRGKNMCGLNNQVVAVTAKQV